MPTRAGHEFHPTEGPEGPEKRRHGAGDADAGAAADPAADTASAAAAAADGDASASGGGAAADAPDAGSPRGRRGPLHHYTPQQRALAVLCWHESGRAAAAAAALLASRWPAEWGDAPAAAVMSNVPRWSAHLLQHAHLFNLPPGFNANAPEEGAGQGGDDLGVQPKGHLPGALRLWQEQKAVARQRAALAAQAEAQAEARAALASGQAQVAAAAVQLAARTVQEQQVAAALQAQQLSIQLQRAVLEQAAARQAAAAGGGGGGGGGAAEADGFADADADADGDGDGDGSGDAGMPDAGDASAAPLAPAAAAAPPLPRAPPGRALEGPSDAYWFVEVTPDALEAARYSDLVADPGAGAIASFVGTTRDTFQGKRVLRLEYEAYVPMALAKLKELCLQMRRRWAVSRVAVAHRIGPVEVCEASVVIVASSAHRRAALEAVHWAIDELKATVPIWKKEFFTDGSVWKENEESRRLLGAVARAEGRAAGAAGGGGGWDAAPGAGAAAARGGVPAGA
ncbi:molybdopterin synthase catalytic subunit-like [Raphidocelis subcapitata]|uniref:Molybdopterin synthase catalytic subunit n=1 Tax=Raphidocelis subcapitata TaxID=307507 RepID=A0A2V0NUY8_9CHLO|nr:molybdopterin synthase catalytic subunit-like [Raphidocelis subcapitata]|eukprot:GBF91446.1 molybdopterin synthase catalytic subunit-like [Raphidocelis subcapitata]